MVQSKVEVKVKSQRHVTTDDQSVLVPSPLGIKGVPSERISNRNQEVYIKETFFMLPLGGLHVKHAEKIGIRVPTQHLLWDQKNHGKH
jgi:hypothetical protein